MKISTLRYLFKEGIIGLWRNRLMSLASIGTIVLSLLILGVSYTIAQNSTYILKQLETRFGITAYIEEGTTEKRTKELQTEIQNIEGVVEVQYVSKEEALDIFTKEYEDASLFEEFKKDNPLPASLEIVIDRADRQAEVVEALKGYKELNITYFDQETDLFIKVNYMAQVIVAIVITCLIVIGLLLMSNTIRLTVYVRKKEISIMKYIGATDWFIRLPFLIEGLIIGVIGALIPVGVVGVVYSSTAAFITEHLGEILKGISLYETSTIMSRLLPICLSIGVGIGLVGSIISIRKYLKV